jgi:hypothetical protein
VSFFGRVIREEMRREEIRGMEGRGGEERE